MTRADDQVPGEDALESVRRAREVAAIAIDSSGGAEAAFRLATDLANAFREAADEIAAVRAREAARLRDAEGLSLAGLADRLGISKPRADQLMRIAKAQQP